MATALCVMDFQTGIVSRFEEAEALLASTGRAIAAARDAGIPVVYVRVAFRPGYPEASPRNRAFAALAQQGGDAFTVHSPATQVHAAVAPAPGEPVVVKKRVSAFAGSDFEVLLRALGATHLVLCGIATSGVVLSTLREAADRDYELTVLSDCCADGDDEVHRVLLEKVFPRQAAVTDAATWAQSLAGAH